MAFVADILVLSSGSEGSCNANSARSIVQEVVESTLDLTIGNDMVEEERSRFMGNCVSNVRALPAPSYVIALPAPETPNASDTPAVRISLTN